MTAAAHHPQRGPTLRIICVNDVYTLENLPRLSGLVRHHAGADRADLLLTTLAGDFVGPSLLSNLDRGRGMVDCLNAVPIDVVSFGNHEDDVGIEALRERVAEFRGTWLNSNVPGFTPKLPAHRVVAVAAPGGRSVRVGLLGVVMADAVVYRRPPFGDCPVEPANRAALRTAAGLLAQERCACVIPLTHQFLAEDRLLALAQRRPRFPVIVGGHEHLSIVEQVQGCFIVKAGADAVQAAIVDLAWPAEAPPPGEPDLPEVRVRIEAVSGYPEDPALRARVDAHMAAVRELATATLLRLRPDRPLSSVGTRARQTSMGALLCSRLRDALGADGGLINGGGIRGARVYSDRLTFGDLEVEVPFDNEVVVVALPGGVLRDAVAWSRARAPLESGAFLQLDDGMEVGPDQALTGVAGAPLQEERLYRIAVIRELLTGIDHIEPLVRYGREHPERLPPVGSGRGIRVVLVEAFAVELWRQLGGFDRLDEDRDGVVSPAEVATGIGRLHGEPCSPLAVEQVMSALDTDRDRVISRAEAAAVPGPDRDGPSG